MEFKDSGIKNTLYIQYIYTCIYHNDIWEIFLITLLLLRQVRIQNIDGPITDIYNSEKD